ncbi:hypothetical protein O9929_03565 [Vibrio lentus]|nr:hypothetical protein [Vibrio lentus]
MVSAWRWKRRRNLTQFAAGMSITALWFAVIIGTFVGRAVYSKWMSVGVASASALLLLH